MESAVGFGVVVSRPLDGAPIATRQVLLEIIPLGVCELAGRHTFTNVVRTDFNARCLAKAGGMKPGATFGARQVVALSFNNGLLECVVIFGVLAPPEIGLRNRPRHCYVKWAVQARPTHLNSKTTSQGPTASPHKHVGAFIRVT